VKEGCGYPPHPAHAAVTVLRMAAPPTDPAQIDVTVVIPAWDRYVEEFLPEAVRSVLEQDLPAEVVLVDNASNVPVTSMNGERVVRADKRITVGAARNLGLAAVRTPFVVFWDADDLMLPGTLRVMHERLGRAPEAVAVATAILERTDRPHHWPRSLTRPLAKRSWLFRLVHAVSALFPTTGSVMIRTAQARDAGGFADADGGDDWALGVSLAFRGPILLDDHAGRVYRRWPGSLSDRWRTVPDLVEHAAAVRRRLRGDTGVPRWIRGASPVLAPAHLLVIFVLRPLRLALRRGARLSSRRARDAGTSGRR
jgi:glycosyltransferase involved in cell wall biosynthesis